MSTTSSGVGGSSVEHAERRPAGADRAIASARPTWLRHLEDQVDVADRLLGVPAGHRTEVGHDPAAQPVVVHARADLVDDAGHLAARDGRERRRGIGPGSPRRSVVSSRWTPAAATAIRTWPGPGSRSGQLVEHQVLGGTEFVKSDQLSCVQ